MDRVSLRAPTFLSDIIPRPMFDRVARGAVYPVIARRTEFHRGIIRNVYPISAIIYRRKTQPQETDRRSKSSPFFSARD